MKKLGVAAMIAVAAGLAPTLAQAEGNFVAPPSEPLQLDITGNLPELSQTTFEIETGVYYRLTITSDGVEEFMFAAPDLLRNSHIRLVVINDIEVHLQGLTFHGIEFDDGGAASVSFVVLRPGEYAFTVGEATGTFIAN
jgi:hypothetical protein